MFIGIAVGTPYTIQDFGGSVGLGTLDLKTTIINVISWLLSLLGIVALVMIIVGGFTWMTAAGDEMQLELAKKRISNAVVGIVVILVAWALVSFVINTTINVTV